MTIVFHISNLAYLKENSLHNRDVNRTVLQYSLLSFLIYTHMVGNLMAKCKAHLLYVTKKDFLYNNNNKNVKASGRFISLIKSHVQTISVM